MDGYSPLEDLIPAREPPRLVFVDDEPLILQAIVRQLRDTNYQIRTFDNPLEALKGLEQQTAHVVVSDQRMPDMTGARFLAEVRQRWPRTVRMLLSGQADMSDLAIAINEAGIHRFMAKPWNVPVLREALESAVQEAEAVEEIERLTAIVTSQNTRLRMLNQELTGVAIERTQKLKQRQTELSQTLIGAIRVLLKAIEAKDPYTAGHSELVSRYAIAFAQEIGEIEDLNTLRFGTLVHDVGKIGIPESILVKPGRLDDDEMAMVRSHPEIGVRITQAMDFRWNIFPIVRNHHERWDGDGYPDKLKGDQIPFNARLVALCDVYEALTAERSYRKPMQQEAIINLFESQQGKQFDPGLVPCFLELVKKGLFTEVRREVGPAVRQEIDVFTQKAENFVVQLRED